MPDLIEQVFLLLRNEFFTKRMEAIPFNLREKRTTQDDPLDEYIIQLIQDKAVDFQCEKSSGPLISPDFVICRKELCENQNVELLEYDLNRIVAVEAKKLERGSKGNVARASGLDYNTTPPCGTVIVYDSNNKKIKIHSFYLFICLENVAEKKRTFKITSLVLCDGDVINENFKLYKRIVGERIKEINLGTYKNGANRARPMLIFPNPMGALEFSRTCILIHPKNELGEKGDELSLIFYLIRKIKNKSKTFYCYQKIKDVAKGHEVKNLINPFPTPKKRREKTSPRGKFKLSFATNHDN